MTRADINTVIIPDTKRIWVVHPGKNKKFFGDFETTSRIYLEYPGLNVSFEALQDDDLMRRKIRYSLELAKFGALTRENGTDIKLADFEGDATTDVTVFLRTVRHLFENMKKGDLVISPGWGPYSRVLFGELVEDVNFDHQDRIDPNYFVDTQFRNVRWLTTDRRKQELPEELIKYVTKPPAIAEVARDHSTERFFDFAYSAYVREGLSWSSIQAPDYQSDDPSAISDPIRLIEFAVAAYRAVERGQSLAGMTLEDVIRVYYDKQDIEYFGLSFRSPGRLDFRARNTRLSLFVSLVIALGTAGALSGCKATGEQVELTNSASAHDGVTPELQDQINSFIQDMDGNAAGQAEKLAQSSNQKTGLSTVVKVDQ